MSGKTAFVPTLHVTDVGCSFTSQVVCWTLKWTLLYVTQQVSSLEILLVLLSSPVHPHIAPGDNIPSRLTFRPAPLIQADILFIIISQSLGDS